jgi:nitrite reductase/ring-hydroxylating ferredoxin subunit
MPTEEQKVPSAQLGRRAMLTGGAGCALLALLAACGGTEPEPSQPGQATDDPGIEGFLVRVASVPVGGGAVGNGVIVLQPVQGTFKAYDATCTHQAFLVRPGTNGNIHCAGHDSTFSGSDGSVMSGPAPSALRPVTVRVEGEYILRG